MSTAKKGKSGMVTSENTPIKVFGMEAADLRKRTTNNLTSVVAQPSSAIDNQSSLKNKRKYSNVVIT